MGTRRMFVGALMLAACGSPPGASDAAVDDAGVSGPVPPAPPAWTCPDGWRAASDAEGEVSACEPWPASGRRDDCAFDEAHFPGGPGCERIGTECASDGWPTDLPGDRPVFYVDDEAPEGGDGTSRATALRSITDAIVLAPDGAIIALATGRYDVGTVDLGPGQTLWGACVSGTRLTSSVVTETEVVVDLAFAGAGIRNLAIDTPARLGIGVSARDVLVEQVVVHAARSNALIAASGSVTVRDARISDVAAAGDGTAGRAIEAQAGSEVVLERVVILRARENAILATTASVTARDLAVIGTLAGPDGTEGRAVAAQHDAQVTLERAVLEEAREHAMLVGAGAVIEASDVVIRDTQTRPDGTLGRGAQALSGGRIVLERALVERSFEVAIVAADPGTVIVLRDVLVRDVSATVDGSGGRCVAVQSSAHVVLERVDLRRCREVAIQANDPGTAIEGSDVSVRSIASGLGGTGGRGVSAHLGAHVTLERVALTGCREIALGASDLGTRVEVRDLSIADTQAREVDGDMGVGVWAQMQSEVVVSSARIERAHLLAAAVLQDSQLTLDHIAVSDVREAACAASGCADPGGFGLAAYYGGRLRVTDFEVIDVPLCGVVVGQHSVTETQVDLERGVIRDAPVGACVQAEGFDTSRLRVDVEYRGVDVPLQATTYALPDAF